MEDGACADCETLRQAALEATVRHIHAESRLAIAKLVHDTRNIEDLELFVERLGQARTAAVRAYQEHIATHPQEAASAKTA
jgi:hypothetical protein